MALIDTHAHLDSYARKGELGAVLDRAKDAGVNKEDILNKKEDNNLF